MTDADIVVSTKRFLYNDQKHILDSLSVKVIGPAEKKACDRRTIALRASKRGCQDRLYKYRALVIVPCDGARVQLLKTL